MTAAARTRLAIRGVSYSYPGSRPVLDDVDLDVTPGALTLVFVKAVKTNPALL